MATRTDSLPRAASISPSADEAGEEREREDEVPRLRRGRVAEVGDGQRQQRHDDHAGGQDRPGAVLDPEPPRADRRQDQHRSQRDREAGGEVSGDVPEIVEHGERPDELLAAAADPDLEPARKDEVAVPEGRAENGDHAQRDDRLPRTRAREYIQTL